MKNEPVIIERTLNAPIAKVWKAITDNNEIKQWYFRIAEFKPEPGFEFSFEASNENKTYVHLCKIKEVITGKKISYAWRYKGYEGNSLVTFELSSEADKTKIKLTHQGLETFPQDTPDFPRKNFEAGWTHIIGKSLKEFVEKL